MNYYELGKYAGYKNIPLHTLLDFSLRNDSSISYISGFIEGRMDLNAELNKDGDEMMKFFETRKLP